MTRNEMKALIEKAFYRIARAAESSTEGDKLLRAAFDAAVSGERQHRKSMGDKYRLPVETTARYFVVKWFAEPRGSVTCARDATAMRPDCLYAMALRELLDSEGKQIDTCGVAGIDYSADIAPVRT